MYKKKLLLSSKNYPIVSDGLLFWLDGRDKLIGELIDDDYYVEATITDRSGNHSIKIYDGESSQYCRIRKSKGFITQSNSNSNITRRGKWDIYPIVYGVKTVEIVWKKPNVLTNYYVAGMYSLSTSVSSNVRFNGVPFIGDIAVRGQTHHLVFTIFPRKESGDVDVRAYVDGQRIDYTEGSVSGYSDSIYIQNILTRYSSSSTTHGSSTTGCDLAFSDPISIGCVRMYDRPLTEKEILKNYAYEQSIGRVL